MPRIYQSDPRNEIIEFNGVKYHRRPYSKHRHLRVYFWPHSGWKGKRRLGALHVEIWKHHHGPVPKGHLIHHVDENPLNNALENLACITWSEHGKLHKNGAHLVRAHNLPKHTHQCIHCGQSYQTFRKKRTKYCRQACEKAYLRKHKLHHETKQCEFCGGDFTTDRYSPNRFCSHKCATHSRHKRFEHERNSRRLQPERSGVS